MNVRVVEAPVFFFVLVVAAVVVVVAVRRRAAPRCAAVGGGLDRLFDVALVVVRRVVLVLEQLHVKWLFVVVVADKQANPARLDAAVGLARVLDYAYVVADRRAARAPLLEEELPRHAGRDEDLPHAPQPPHDVRARARPEQLGEHLKR